MRHDLLQPGQTIDFHFYPQELILLRHTSVQQKSLTLRLFHTKLRRY